jgi:enamine deaminase RidA (YjgF/YER057c/UK114 family)
MIIRHPGSIPQRSRGVSYGGTIVTVALATVKSPSLYDQARQALERLDSHLMVFGVTKSHLLSVIVYLADISRKEEFNDAWNVWVDPENPPVRVCVGAALEGNDLVEILATAAGPCE